MFVCELYRRGAHAVQRIMNGHTFTRRTPYFPLVGNQFLENLRDQLFCTASGKLLSEGENEVKQKISVTFVDKDGEETVIKVPVGMSMLEAAHENDIELEGACEGSLACSTCHVIVEDANHSTNYQIQRMRKMTC